MSKLSENGTPDSPLTSPKQKSAMGHFMTPVRRILFRLEWYKSSRRRKSRPLKKSKESALNLLPILDSISERSSSRFSPSMNPPPQPLGARARLRKYKPKRRHSIDLDDDDSDSHDTPRRVAIQQEDASFDAIVVTTLPNYPFCCHEDLVGMTREQLLTVARTLNARLPLNSQIPVDGHTMMMADVDVDVDVDVVRSSIEVLVGIVPPPVPGAPKAVKWAQSLSVGMDVEVDEDGDGEGEGGAWLQSPPSSPLVMKEMRRRRRAGVAPASSSSRGAWSPNNSECDAGKEVVMSPFACISPQRFLERLEEEDEPEEEEEDDSQEEFYEEDEEEGDGVEPYDGHAVKRRKVSSDGRYARILPANCLIGGGPGNDSAQQPRHGIVEMMDTTNAGNTSSTLVSAAARRKFRVPRKPVRVFLEDEDDEKFDNLFGEQGMISSGR